jgi:hypothetical protein
MLFGILAPKDLLVVVFWLFQLLPLAYPEMDRLHLIKYPHFHRLIISFMLNIYFCAVLLSVLYRN